MENPAPNDAKHGPAQSVEPLRANRIAALRRQIGELGAQIAAKEQELWQLHSTPASSLDLAAPFGSRSASMRPEQKIALFLDLFGARRDVYPRYWENAVSGKKGYSPAYEINSRSGVPEKRFLPLDERAVEAHLRGRQAIGVYALRTDDSCIFLAADFDGECWRDNVLAYKRAAQKAGVTVAIERSRSGNGAHAWTFFSEPVPTALARDECALDLSRPAIKPGMASGDITLRLDSGLHVPRTIAPAVLAALKRLATFANPVFHQKLRLRFATYDTPRFNFAGEWHPDRLVLPRGAMDAAVAVLESAGANVTIQDARPEGDRTRWTFHGELRPEQEKAVREMVKHDIGVLCAPPGAGKTVMGCALAARHRTSTLVLVHRTVLMDQWRKEAGRFLGILKRKEIGIWRGATRRLTRQFDIAMLPSLTRVEDYAAFFQGYGLVIVDECHHVPAVTFEELLKACPCRKIVGLTATPVRKDGLEKLLYLQCGPIRHSIPISIEDAVSRTVYVRRSSFHVPDSLGDRPPIHAVWEALVADVGRTKQIAGDILSSIEEGRCPLVLSDRKAHLDNIEAELKTRAGGADIVINRLESGMGKKRRQTIRDEIERKFATGEKLVLLATASLIGEGYDLPTLDTLFLAMPLSFQGRLIQYAGRLHRQHAGKREIRVYDYLDEDNALTAAMFRRRSAAYRQMGYRMVMDEEAPGVQLSFQ